MSDMDVKLIELSEAHTVVDEAMHLASAYYISAQMQLHEMSPDDARYLEAQARVEATREVHEQAKRVADAATAELLAHMRAKK